MSYDATTPTASQDCFERYPPEAFQFVREGLEHTARLIHGELGEDDLASLPDRHVTGTQLCLGLRDYALEQYGRLALTVLRRWNIRRTEDFGHIVFAMVDAGLLRKTEEDTLEDFRDIFDFSEEFGAVSIC